MTQPTTGAGATLPSPASANAAAAGASAGMAGDATNASQSCPAVTVEIGVFFDGTSNNRANAQANDTGQGGSFANAESNVSLLQPLYYDNENDTRNSCGGYARRFASEYVEGIGTYTGGDSTAGQATGRGSTGVENRVFDAAIQVGQVINRLSPGIEPEEVILDVFGFSRGAAAARHFVNAFNRGNLTYYRNWIYPKKAYLPEGRNVRIRFIGIFDTVASIQAGGGSNGHGNLDMDLSSGSSDAIMHLTAEHEIRENFPLTDTRGAPQSREMPGVHSDVGGGYRGTGDDVQVEMPRSYIETSRSAAQTKMQQELLRLDARKTTTAAPFVSEGYILPTDVQSAFVYRASAINTFVIPSGPYGPGMVQYDFKIHTHLRRPWVKPDMSKISLHVMHKAAKDNSVPFHDIDESDAAYAFPADMEPAARTMIGGGNPSAAERAHLLRNYMHHSAHYDMIYPVVGAPMRERAGRQRRIIANNPGNAE